MDLRSAMKRQYHAALRTLRKGIELCPEPLWLDQENHPSSFWQIAYHAVFYTDLYSLQRDEDFQPWEKHREEYQFLQEVPPDDRPPRLGEPYSKQEVLDYLEIVDGRIDSVVEGLDLETDDCGFWWYDMPKLDHELMNIRHTQHHAAQLADRLERATGRSIDWVGSAGS
ncbi:MAG: DinB family protein [Planctomycetota bacterium]